MGNVADDPSNYDCSGQKNEISDYFVAMKYMQFQACALLLDDIMDDSHTRRDQICRYRRPEVLQMTSHFLFSMYPFLSFESRICLFN